MRSRERSTRGWLTAAAVVAITLSTVGCGAEISEEGGVPGQPVLNTSIVTTQGEVTSLDTKAQTLSIEEVSGRRIEVRTNQATVITVGGIPASLQDVPRDAAAVVTYDEAGRMAVRIVVTTHEGEPAPSPRQTPTAIQPATSQPGAATPNVR